jgi:hypothetical protein
MANQTACEVGQHADPDNSGQCISCNAILDPLDEIEFAEAEERMEREAQAREARGWAPA